MALVHSLSPLRFHLQNDANLSPSSDSTEQVRQINPAYTSRRCSKCGFTHEDNRPHTKGKDEFGCLKYGYDIHADYNAAKNIGLKYLRAKV